MFQASDFFLTLILLWAGITAADCIWRWICERRDRAHRIAQARRLAPFQVPRDQESADAIEPTVIAHDTWTEIRYR